MSTCKKCDRCGEHYAKDFDNRKLGKLYDNGSTTKNEWDLCPDCWESFDSWIANDDSTPKNDVGDDEVDANDADAASVSFSSVTETGNADSRAKLEEDANAIAIDYWDRKRTWDDANDLKRDIIALLDRQAAITRAEFDKPGWEYCETCEEIARLRDVNERQDLEYIENKKRIADLQQQADDLRGEWHRVCAERANLARDLAECMDDRDRYRELCGQMLDAAHEIRRIADANMPEGAAL